MGNTDSSSPKVGKEQWVDKVISFSSQYGTGSWSANQICGPPKVYPHYGDNVGAWTTSRMNGNQEHLELGFKIPIIISELRVYFTFNPNPITRILFKKGDKWDEVLKRNSANERNNAAIIYKPEIKKVQYLTNEVRIEMDTTGFTGWTEIDCVKIVGVRRIIGECKPPNKLSANGRNNLEMYVCSGSHSYHDCVLKLLGSELKVHRYILSTRSEFFNNLFKKDEKVKVFTLDPFIPKKKESLTNRIFDLFIQYLYSGYVELTPDDLFPCYEVSKIFESKDFEDYLISYFESYVDDKVCVKVLKVAKRRKYHRISKIAYTHLARHLQSVKIEYPQIMELLSEVDIENINKIMKREKKE